MIFLGKTISSKFSHPEKALGPIYSKLSGNTSFFKFLHFEIYLKCMSVLPMYISVCHMCAEPVEAIRGHQIPRSGVIGFGNHLGPLEEQSHSVLSIHGGQLTAPAPGDPTLATMDAGTHTHTHTHT